MTGLNEPLPGQMTAGALRDKLASCDPHALVVLTTESEGAPAMLRTVTVEDHGAAVVVRPTPVLTSTELFDRAIEGFPAKAAAYRAAVEGT